MLLERERVLNANLLNSDTENPLSTHGSIRTLLRKNEAILCSVLEFLEKLAASEKLQACVLQIYQKKALKAKTFGGFISSAKGDLTILHTTWYISIFFYMLVDSYN